MILIHLEYVRVRMLISLSVSSSFLFLRILEEGDVVTV